MIDYRDWLTANGLARLVLRVPSRATVVRGEVDNRIAVEVVNDAEDDQRGKVSLDLPPGWRADAEELPYTAGPRDTAVLTFRCTVPADAAIKGHDVIVRRGRVKEPGTLDVVPGLALKHLVTALPVDADPAKWERAGTAAVPIPPTNLVQGRVQGPKECSGRFFVGYDDRGIQVLVDVSDDTVCRNIAPDDIKAHWRSTSVEICLDPTPRSENTFTAFKLGIFPQDTAGTVRAARDADANPGELGRIKSKIQLASRLTDGGYIVEARIPWAEVCRGAPPKALGFNVILYHAGKKEARVGEDVGKARLAWSFWPGVPGRPEVWGMAYLR
jgi:hypothetical protein